MYVLRLQHAPQELTQSVVDELSSRGDVGIVRTDGRETAFDLPEDTTVVTSADPGEDALDLLAPRCDFALLVDVPIEFGGTLTIEEGAVNGSFLDEPTPTAELPVSTILDRLEETEPYVTLESLVAEIKERPEEDRAGAIATFTGRVRAKDGPEDTPTEQLEFERYGEVAREEMQRIREELAQRDGVYEVLMHHRTGVLPAGRDIVFVVVLAGHRSEAFSTVADGINRLKAEVPIFKKEVTIDEEYWVHNRP